MDIVGTIFVKMSCALTGDVILVPQVSQVSSLCVGEKFVIGETNLRIYSGSW